VLRGATAPWSGLKEGYAHPSHAQEWGLVLLAVVLFGAGLLVAWLMYGRGGDLPSRLARAAGPVYRLVYRKYWVDELYDRLLIRPYYGLCRFFAGADQWVVDGAVNGTAASTRGAARVSGLFDQWVVDLLVNFVAYFVRFGGWVMRRAQTGFVQSYAGVMILGAFALLAIYLLYLTS
jgi:NADH-quinone oxidoreductase subunit L